MISQTDSEGFMTQIRYDTDRLQSRSQHPALTECLVPCPTASKAPHDRKKSVVQGLDKLLVYRLTLQSRKAFPDLDRFQLLLSLCGRLPSQALPRLSACDARGAGADCEAGLRWAAAGCP